MSARERSPLAAARLLCRAASYRRFLPDWPALAQSLEREAYAAIDAAKQLSPNLPQTPRKAPR